MLVASLQRPWSQPWARFGWLLIQDAADEDPLEEVRVIVGYQIAKPDRVRLRRRAWKEDPLLLTPEQVARRLKISRSMVYLLLADPNGIPSISIGRCRRIRESDLLAWVEAQANPYWEVRQW